MRLSDEYFYMVLCEDMQMKSFIQGFLSHQGISSRKYRFRDIPAGRGCGEAYVRREYPSEVKEMKRKNYIRKALIVCLDADNRSVSERKKQLEQECIDQEMNQVQDKESPIIIWIPKRQIETWIRFLRGEDTDESRDYRHDGKPERCRREAELLSGLFQRTVSLDRELLPSIEYARDEYDRVCQLQQMTK